MAIPYADISADLKNSLDSEGSDYYRDDLDLVPAINKAQDFLMGLILPKFGSKKFNAELFKGLIKTRIFQPSIYSRIYVDQVIDTWGIISIYINPVVAIPPAASTTFTPATVTSADLSAMLPNYIYVSGGKSARRLNSQEWSKNTGNPFEGGYLPQANELPAVNLYYGYLTHVDNESTINTAQPYEITIRPFITSTTPVAITFASYPSRLTGNGAGQTLDWNQVFKQLISRCALKFLTDKMGIGGKEMYQVTEKDMDSLIMLNS